MSEFGTESCFNTVNTEYNAVAKLDATHVVVAYKDTGGSGYGCAKVGVIDGNTVTWGAENCFNSAITSHISVTSLDATHFVVGYRDGGNLNHGTAIVGLVSGTIISSYGSENVFNSAGTYYISVSALDSTHFAVGYNDDGGSTYGCARIGVTSGTTISSYGAENCFNAGNTLNVALVTLDSTHFVAVYRDGANLDHGTAIVGVVSGTTISSYGAENVFNSAATYRTFATALDSTHFVAVYQDNGNSDHGTAIVGVVSGTTISSYGAENVFNSVYTREISVSTLDSTHFVVTYKDDGGADYGCARQGTVSGTTISSYDTEQTFNSAITIYTAVAALSATDYIVVYKDDGGNDYGCARIWGTTLSKEFGSELCFNTVNTEYNAVAKLDATHVVVAYKDTGGAGYGCAKVGVISGNTVTWGAELCFNSAVTEYVSVAALDSTHFVVAYEDDGGDDYGCARVGLVSGTTISSYGVENVFNSAITYYTSVATFDSTHFVVAYTDNGNSNFGTAVVGVVSGTTISSYGAENVFNSATSYYESVTTLDSTHFVVAYKDEGNSNFGTAIVGIISGVTISSYGAENVFNSGLSVNISVAALDSTHFVVAYKDGGNSNFGTAIVGVVSSTTISSYGAENVFNSDISVDIMVSILDSTHFVTVYRDYGNSSYGTAIEGTVSGTTISSYGAENVFNSTTSVYTAVAALSATDYIVVYKDDGGADYGCGRVWGTGSGWSGIIIGVSSPAKVMGVAIADITSVVGIS